MAVEKPTWLDECYVQKVLRNAEKDESIKVSGIIVKPATAHGDNYASDMHRVNVIFNRVLEGRKITETRSVIAKVAPQGGIREEMISNGSFFQTEMAMMSETLPRMNQILSGSITTSLAARCLHVQYSKPQHLIIEDLVPKGFRMVDRQAGLDLDHCLLAIRNLAAFHASSIALLEKDPKVATKYNQGMFHKDRSAALGQFFRVSTKALAEEATKWPELSPRILEKLSKLSDCIYEMGCEAALFRKDDFNVLNHGDFWVNNMLFRYDERQNPIDHIFVDFQIVHHGSAAIDILYFFGTSPSNEVRTNNRELILREYHNSLLSIMGKLKCNTKAPSFDRLQEILKERALCEMIPAFTVLPIVLVDKSHVKSLDEMLIADGEYEILAYKGKLYREVITKLIPVYDSMGLLDI